MKKVFDKHEFIKKNNEFLYHLLEDFIKTEVTEETFWIIYNFLKLNNFKSGEFEGNQYLIQKKNTEEVLIIDIVSEEFKSDFSQTRFAIGVDELMQLMEELRPSR
ncbi:hypothetical protein [Defluviitalea phaphyphila]|uniref:hypothetical protein n=1 Tax=Defluviitalea phaphyphila TaxID=1473580 RepID=UPI0007308058|nr:hypothetical protein [Defluviitalea phaphyphila]